jgi:hypothetical protein
MRPIIERPPADDAPSGPLWRRLVWMAGLALTSMIAVAAVAYALKALLPAH